MSAIHFRGAKLPRARRHVPENGLMTTGSPPSQQSPTWGFTEAWLLLSIGDHGSSGCTLSQMIGTADARNHDIPTREATAVALGRLEASGLVECSAERLTATKEGRHLVKQRSADFFRQASSLLPFLAEVPCREGLHRFEPGEFESAYEEYAKR
jgi:hypothetical protein